MHYPVKLDQNHVKIYHEGRKRRIYVGEISYDAKSNRYALTYDKKYTLLKNAIPLGPTLSLFELTHYSEKGKMFPIFLDRIPDPRNPAYPDYCASQGISVEEKNPIVLLGTIGRRGPSSFIFEAVYTTDFKPKDITSFRQELNLTQHDFAEAFDISLPTLQRIEANKSHDENSLKRIEIMLSFPEVALWQLAQTGGRIHRKMQVVLKNYFRKRLQSTAA